jgi:hypothetical protein
MNKEKSITCTNGMYLTVDENNKKPSEYTLYNLFGLESTKSIQVFCNTYKKGNMYGCSLYWNTNVM